MPATNQTSAEIARIDTVLLPKAKSAARAAWAAACRYDQIPTNSPAAVFSEENPHAKEVDRAWATVARLVNKRRKLQTA